eukprot:TRINITY_DN93958_c0_g1_i1.p1 TRINITY_DN93958_c0_g1~~TRINITY_DN93958_c0_g1_i1.p1  ORF type:complete len:541 (+),score=86.66 TRINITY_DN93958_c0_g1_i1:30-1652(+)
MPASMKWKDNARRSAADSMIEREEEPSAVKWDHSVYMGLGTQHPYEVSTRERSAFGMDDAAEHRCRGTVWLEVEQQVLCSCRNSRWRHAPRRRVAARGCKGTAQVRGPRKVAPAADAINSASGAMRPIRSRKPRPRIRGPEGTPREGSHLWRLLVEQQGGNINVRGLELEIASKANQALAKGSRCDASVLDGGVTCVSLPSCRQRRRHTEMELERWGFPEPKFVDALGPEDDEVLRWFNSPKVAKFPPCFRCGLDSECVCNNNCMLLEQIANWLSFRKAWRHIAGSQHEWHLLVEDDVKFTHKAGDIWNDLITQDLLDQHAKQPCMIRCGWQLGLEYVDDEPPELIDDAIRMSNHCSIMNRAMAQQLLLSSNDFISSTSDVFAHEVVAPCYRHFTMFPPMSYDLSFALKVPSLIRPKGTELDDPVHAMQVAKSLKIDIKKIRCWLQSLVWVQRAASEAPKLLKSPKVPVLAGWAVLLISASTSGDAGPSCIVCDPKPPPPWIFAAYRFYIGDAAFRPREFRSVSLKWLKEAELSCPDPDF